MVALGSAVLMGTTVRIRMDNYIPEDMCLLLLNTCDGLPISVLPSFAVGSLKDPNCGFELSINFPGQLGANKLLSNFLLNL